jgi:crotonobetaine/carnitine-CoA ligase
VTDSVWTSNAEQWTLRTLLERRLELDADSEYLDVCATKVTAGNVAQMGSRVANVLIDLNIQPGDRVATIIENSPEAVMAWWGTILAGAISVPVNTAYKGEYLRHQLHDAGAKVLIVESGLADRRLSYKHTQASRALGRHSESRRFASNYHAHAC